MRKSVGEVSFLSGREPLSTKAFWEKTNPRLVVTSYVVKPKSTSKSNMLTLSTMQPILGMIKDDGKKKLAIIKLQLAMALIKLHMAHHLDNAPNLTDCLRKSMMHFLGRRAAIHPQVGPQPQQSKKRCAIFVWSCG